MTIGVRVVTNAGAIDHAIDGWIITAEPNKHGDLVVVRYHGNMLMPQTIASYAAGQWLSHDSIDSSEAPSK